MAFMHWTKLTISLSFFHVVSPPLMWLVNSWLLGTKFSLHSQAVRRPTQAEEINESWVESYSNFAAGMGVMLFICTLGWAPVLQNYILKLIFGRPPPLQ